MDNKDDKNLNEKQENRELQQQQEEQQEMQNAQKQQQVINAAASAMKSGAKAAGKKLWEITKKAVMTLLKILGPKVLIIAIIVVIFAASVYGVIEGIFGIISKVANNIFNNDFINSSYTYDQDIDFSNGIEITDEQIQNIVDNIEKNGESLEALYLSGDIDKTQDKNSPENIKQRNKYLRQFLLAQLCTEYPDFGITEDETHYNGIIKIRKSTQDSDGTSGTDMKYVKLQTFKSMVNAINANSMESSEKTYAVKEETTTITGTNGSIPVTIITPNSNLSHMPMVLMVHKFAGSKEGSINQFITLGRKLAENGIAAITIDLPGSGASEVESINYTINKITADMDSAIKYMKNNYSIDSSKVGVVGHGMGGRMAALYLDNVSAAALWAPTAGDGLTGLEFLENYQSLYQTAMSTGKVESGYNFTLSKEFFEQMEQTHPQVNISNFSGSNLLIAYDSADVEGKSGVVSAETVQMVKSSAPSGTKWVEYNDDHNFTMNGESLIKDTADLFCNSFLGHNASRGEINPELLQGYTLDQLKEEIKDVYTIDGSGNLYFANWHIKETTEVPNATQTEMTVTEQAVNYQKTIEKYSMPMQATLALCMITQNPEYVYNFIQENVLSGEIVINIQEAQSVDTYNSWFDWKITTHTKTSTYSESTGKWSEHTSTSSKEYNDQNHVTIVNTDVQCSASVTEVNTWMFKESIEYTNNKGKVSYPMGIEKLVNEDAKSKFPGTLQGSTTKNGTTDDGRPKNTTTWQTLDWCNFTETEKTVYNEWQQGTVKVDNAAIEQKADKIIAQWKIKYNIPNSNLIEAPLEKIYSGEKMLLQLLNDNDKTQKQAEIFKYLIQRSKDPNYVIANIDLSIYQNTTLEAIDAEDDIVVNVSKSQGNIVLSKDQIKQAIETCYSGMVKNNLLSALDSFWEIQTTNKVNAIFAIAVAMQESSGGTNWGLIDSKTYNWMSVQLRSGFKAYEDKNGTKWSSYESFSQATKDFGNLIFGSSYYFEGGNNTVRTIGKSYCVPPEGWTNGVLNIMKRLYKSVGIDIEAERKQNKNFSNTGSSTGNNTNVSDITGTVELDGSYNVNGVCLANPIKDSISFVGSYKNHGAVDINPTQNGGTPVYASADGTVTTATYHTSYGNYVIIDHGNGISTCYAHASALVVHAGQKVKKGQLIMYEGSTGNSSGPHVHYEIRINGKRNQSLAETMFRQLGFNIVTNY